MSILSTRTARLQTAFFLFLFFLISAGLVSIIVSEVFRSQNATAAGKSGAFTLRRLIIGDRDLLAAVLLGGMYLLVALTSLPAYAVSKRPTARGAWTKPLAVWNGALVVSGLITVAVGLAMWFFSLHETNNFLKVWEGAGVQAQVVLQNEFQCCGYFNATSSGFFSDGANTGFCASVTNVTFAPCKTPIVQQGDVLLNDLFTTIFGFVAVQVCLLLTSICLINDRHEEERFRKIDQKRGMAGGFV